MSLQVRDIPDQKVIDLIRECNEARCDYSEYPEPGWHGGRPGYGEDKDEPATPHWANRWDLANKLGIDMNLFLAKMRKMVKQGKVSGCACGCRGDFIVDNDRGYW